ncbi:MAG TPA: iron-containing alcohol dehydrogenase, partial [Actinomycetota bacterium]|nr:iron-containing alcohol dehydrogenase [Actinomycetota bacterium]
MEAPHVYVSEDPSEEDAAEALARLIEDLGIERPFVLASKHGTSLTARLQPLDRPTTAPTAADQAWAAELGSTAQKQGADAVIAVGGGRCLDIGKLAAARAGVTIVAAPTQLSHDG